ncbi:DUF418 domain-containing protein [Staphylococcus xylosus]|uniref:DUF418 domain-containing protein n=1 Tax=Staphylococcus xylosus TaxID=1288 RepID=UPI002DB74285|nr:DUF418 domain-containing protein [Staphylococcus xylosus]MEB6289438.1 DUF418 domain-containing protein [Staphylococcus xylosus]MEB7719840.1 DUF418 domain-containing protein [Staphylococcus xylosus]MEB7812999.1 DUF418 domain-containing protein [Staphylococcus xylosus]MEB7821018.1 DUF418 domain-containing protein [Staphylococcus xylosus]MEB7836658.1 DUF418 domain-containing protein [Staphylococcus xylosus]
MSSQQRLYEIDALRGLSLLGIILMNILVFSFPYEESVLSDVVHGFDATLLHGITLLIIGSFYPIFTFLFGYGLSIMYDNCQMKGINYYPIILRRLIFLMIMGVLHGFFVFSGDILFGYAYTGLIAVLFIKSKAKRLIKAAIILFILKILLLVIPFVVFSLLNDPYTQHNFSGVSLAKLIEIKQQGLYTEFLKINALENLYNVLDVVTGSAYLEFLPYILLGIAAQKLKLVKKIQLRKQSAIKWGIICLITGYIVKIPFALDFSNSAYQNINIVGSPIVAAGYILIFIAMYQSAHLAKVLKVFTYPGKLSLSVYLTQSIVLSIVFLGIGGGLYNQLSLYQSYTIALLVYGLQLAGCYFYLKYFKMGPFEWIWRKVTYLK